MSSVLQYLTGRKKNKKPGILWITFITVLSYGQPTQETLSHKSYIAYHTTENITIDGIPSEEAWQKISPTGLFTDIEGHKTPKYSTSVKILWDKECIYFLAEMEEPHVWGNLKQKDTIIFYNNDFEIFIDPDNDTHNYYEFEINALNTLWDLFITKPYREGTPVLNDWDAKGFQSAIQIQGTLNNPDDTDKGWTLEIAIPLAVFKTSYFHDNNPANKFWRVNFSRVNWDFQLINNKYSRKKDSKGNFAAEYNWVWSPTGVIDMHRPEDWGYVYFSLKEAGLQDNFTIPEDEKVKQLLYELYRKQKKYFNKNKRWATSIQELLQSSRNIYDKNIAPTLENHQTGWNISAVSPYTQHTYIIKEDGKIIQKEK
ncbi:carbohydrate-binding family 9-like protein [Abyssalbus ytuae]|uniref:Carbohydrate-binding family 9-like protein n=1 Tax=Abyssalbus ytuae TaxID=2926907 RepID=A0A9E6ZPD2_9FLAO|nr:carbohydrate-binding family 9-like protein [Abyssalbus ytuae]UOB18090.1 carbohydrate-binding family 9-like protein [Abyssalbus ytuae]